MRIILISILLLTACSSLKNQSASDVKSLLTKSQWARYENHSMYLMRFVEGGKLIQSEWITNTCTPMEFEEVGAWSLFENTLNVSVVYENSKYNKNISYEISRISNASLILKDKNTNATIKLKPSSIF